MNMSFERRMYEDTRLLRILEQLAPGEIAGVKMFKADIDRVISFYLKHMPQPHEPVFDVYVSYVKSLPEVTMIERKS